jgi:hypothetical protein
MQGAPHNTNLASSASLKRRLFWLLVCAALGLGIGGVGHYLTANPKWFLALPAVLAAGWLFFANPDECRASCRKDDGATHQ